MAVGVQPVPSRASKATVRDASWRRRLSRASYADDAHPAFRELTVAAISAWVGKVHVGNPTAVAPALETIV